ncbi:MAG: aldolase catalytic domain-containing protein [Lachnospiraceae bacterium]|nr:aldolase catalytic domain-containing protein [Lachnospiraceae bacterium]
MKNIFLLDCTLRDGGFINEWRFGRGDIANLFERSVSAGIDYIEAGFIDEREEFDPDRTITPDSEGMDSIIKGLDHGSSKIFAMIDYGTCDISRIKDAADSEIDGIRVMIKKKTRFEALDFCRQLKEKGYLVGAQPVSVTGYDDDEMRELVSEINKLDPFAMYIVDTYGLLDRSHLLHIFDLIDGELNKGIKIGYHAHNNFQLAFSNSVALMEAATERDIIIDGSAYGMGKSAGNCPLELLTAYMNENRGKRYHTSQILEMIDTGIMKIYESSPWGYQMQYFLCASNDCHPKYAQHLLRKKTLSVKQIDDILSKIEKEKSLSFDKAYIEKLYVDYQKNNINDEEDVERLKNVFSANDSVLVLGPAPTLKEKKKDIDDYIVQNDPLVLTINFLPEGYQPDMLFLSNTKRYMQLSSKLEKKEGATRIPVIATSNLTAVREDFDYDLDYSSLIDESFEIPDNSLPMCLRLLHKTGVKKVALAGFDGYVTERGKNYSEPAMEYEFAADYAIRLNSYTAKVIKDLSDDMNIEFITPSRYNYVNQ